MASASIEAEPVRIHATNFVMAMPVFASSAATTAFVPPDVAISGFPGEVARFVDEHDRDVVAYRVGQLAGVAHELVGVVVDERRRPTLGADQDVEQRRVQIHGHTLSAASER